MLYYTWNTTMTVDWMCCNDLPIGYALKKRRLVVVLIEALTQLPDTDEYSGTVAEAPSMILTS